MHRVCGRRGEKEKERRDREYQINMHRVCGERGEGIMGGEYHLSRFQQRLGGHHPKTYSSQQKCNTKIKDIYRRGKGGEVTT